MTDLQFITSSGRQSFSPQSQYNNHAPIYDCGHEYRCALVFADYDCCDQHLDAPQWIPAGGGQVPHFLAPHVNREAQS